MERLYLDENNYYSANTTPRSRRNIHYFGSPYKKVPGSHSSIGLPDWSHRNHATKINQSYSHQKDTTFKSQQKSLRFLEPDFLYFMDDQMEQDLFKSQDDDDHYYERQISYFSAENSYHGKENAHMPEIEPMFETNSHIKGTDKCYSSRLPDIYQNMPKKQTDSQSTSEMSVIIPENSFASLKQIDKVFNKNYKSHVALPPIVPIISKKTDCSEYSETNSVISDDNKKLISKKKQPPGKGKNGKQFKLQIKPKRKNVHFLKEKKQKDTQCAKKVRPVLPKIVGLRLTYRDIVEREIPAIVTKYLSPIGKKQMSLAQLISLYDY